MPPPLPPGFVLAPASAPPTAPAGRPTLTPLGPPHQPAPPSGYQPAPGGVAPIHGGPADPTRPGGPLDPETQLTGPSIDLQAERYLMTGDLPPLGMGGSGGARQRILNRAAELASAAGHSGGDLATQAANYRTMRQTLQSQQTQLANLQSQESTANLNLDALARAANTLPAQTEAPLLNRVVHSLQRNTTLVPGHQQIAGYDVAYDTAVNEYARLISMGSSGNGQLTDAARTEAESMIPYGSSPTQLQAAIRQARIDMRNRISSYQHTVETTRAGLTGAPAPPAPAPIDPNSDGDFGASIPGDVAAAFPNGRRGGAAPPNPSGTQPPNPPEGGGLGGLLHSVSSPPINPSTPGAPEQQRGAVEFGVAPHVPTGFEQDQIAAYDAFNQANPHATAAQLRQAFPNVSNADQIVAFRDQHGFVAPGSTYVMAAGNDTPEARRARAIAARAAAEPAGVSPVDILPPVLLARMLARSLSGDEAANAVQRGATDTLTMGGADEATAALASAGGNGTYDENVAIQRGIADYDSRNHPISRFAGQFAGGLALPVGEAPTIGRLAAAGAGYGAAYGFGSGEGVTDRLIRAGEGGAAGAIVAPAIKLGADAAGTAYRALRSLGSSSSSAVADAGGPSAPDLIAAAERQGLQNPAADGTPGASPLPADVGGPVTRGVTAGARQLPFASMPITNAANALQSRVGARVGELAGEHGGALPPDQFGDFARTSLENFNKTSGEQGGRTYNRARDLAGDQQFIGMDAVRTIDRHLAELEDNPNTNAPLIAGLERLRGDLAQPEAGLRLKSIDAIRQLRTSVRAEAQTEALRGTDYQRRAGEVLDSLSNDISADLSPDARFAFRHADAQWKERLDFIDNIETNILGPQNSRSAEQIVQRLTNMSRTDSAGMRTLLQTLPQNEAGVIRASLISQLGRPPPGQAAGHDFSLSTFLTNWNKIKDNSRAIENLFPGSQRSDINDLAMIAAGTRRSAAIANNSNSGNAINVGRTVGNLASLGGIVKTLGVSIPIELITGRLLASPRFARWLARPPADPGVGMRRLAQLAAAEPQLSADIIPIQRVLEGGTRAAAAQDTTENPR